MIGPAKLLIDRLDHAGGTRCENIDKFNENFKFNIEGPYPIQLLSFFFFFFVVVVVVVVLRTELGKSAQEQHDSSACFCVPHLSQALYVLNLYLIRTNPRSFLS